MEETALVPQTPKVDSEWPWPKFPKNAPRNLQRYGPVPLEGWEGDFLAAMRDNGILRVACQLARISSTTVYRRRESDPAFAKAYVEAQSMAVDILESAAWTRAVKGVTRTKDVYHKGVVVGTETITEYSDGLLKFLLQANRPDKYREAVDPTQNMNAALQAARRQAIEMGLNPDVVEADAKRLMGLD